VSASNVSPTVRIRIDNLRGHYRSGRDNLGRDFFFPCLQACNRYRRAAGYFSSSALTTWAQVMPVLVQSEAVSIQLLVSPLITTQDRETLTSVASETDRQIVRQQLADRIVEEAILFAQEPHRTDSRGRLLAWMIATGRLELQFAFASRLSDEGLFHEKIGVFDFPWGASVAFTGSANETLAGYSSNFESIDVFRDWHPEDAARVAIKTQQFSEVWDGTAPGLLILRLSRAAMDRVRTYAGVSETSTVPTTPANRWRHQEDAVSEFLKQERGILEMATGTGKTRTALRICKTLIERDELSTIIVTADGTDLLDQWYLQILSLVRELKLPFSVLRHYAANHERDRFIFSPNRRILLASRPAVGPALRVINAEQGRRALLIHDEVHRLGSTGNRKDLAGLSDLIRFRLGLSATPDREYDADGNTFIAQHIGPVLFSFSLEDAIRRGILSPFTYYPLPYTPDADDRTRIHQVHKRAAARKAAGNPMTQEEIWIELARVYKTSKAKLPVFDSFIVNRQHLLKRCIIFVETQEYGQEVLEMVHRYRHDFHTYFAEEDSEVLRRFATGEIECLLTCHRLSEGIDIRNLETVILFASSRTRLETIQRMGRCLRSEPTNPSKRSNVVDFIRAVDPDAEDITADTHRSAWLQHLATIDVEEHLQ
jgi:superfamily II DNA or RNA helicase